MPRDDLDLRGTIAWVFEFAQQNRLALDVSEIPRDAPDLIRQEKESITQRLIKEGLWPGGLNANDAFLILTRYQRGQLKYPPQQTAKWLKNWIREKHNGQCDRITRGEFQKVDSQIDRIVDGYDPNQYGGYKRSSGNNQTGLPLNDIRSLLQKTRDFKALKASFSLLDYITREQLKRGNLHISQNGQKVIYVSQNSCDLECPIPWKALRKLDDFPKNNPARMMAELERLGIIKLKRNYCKELRRCREYWVLFPFSSQHSSLVATLEEGLTLLMNPAELRKMFGRRLTEKILDQGKKT